MKKDLGHLRKVYKKGSLNISSVGSDPLIFFKTWFDDAQSTKNIDEPNAFSLSTIGKDDFPKSRIVLLKSFDSKGFVFFTNYNSSKGKDIVNNPKVCISFFWPFFERQIIIKGTASKLKNKISDKYFDSRPIGSRLGAMVSNQSEVIKNRKILDEKLEHLKNIYKTTQPKRPDNWGGYVVSPISYEFWQGRPNRLHDRIIFNKSNDNWSINRLSP
jgi:pyridoxamine 5'-phosphate oxidase